MKVNAPFYIRKILGTWVVLKRDNTTKELEIGGRDFLHVTIRLHKHHRKNWRLIFHRNANHRCYCEVGWLLDLHTPLFSVFISWYGGETPCVCDKVLAEIAAEN